MRKYRAFLGMSFILSSQLLVVRACFAQDQLTELTVDRPGVAEAPYTVAPKVFQLEIGFDYFKRYNSQLYDLPTSLIRAGVSEKSELRLTLRQDREEQNRKPEIAIAPISLGYKRHIIAQRKRIPEIDILANVIIPASPSPLFSKKLGYEFLLLFQNDFYPNSAINYNIGYTWDIYSGSNVFTANFCYNYLPTIKVGLFVEYFGYMPEAAYSEHGVDAGMTYLVRRNIQVDLSAGISKLDDNTNMFVSAGFAIRLNEKKATSN